MLNHLGGFLLLTAIAVHFTGELGMSCPWGDAFYNHFILYAIHPCLEGQSFSRITAKAFFANNL